MRLARFVPALLLGVMVVVAVAGVTAATASAPSQKVELDFEFEGQAHFTVTDQAPWECAGTHTNEVESGDVSWDTKYDEGISVRLTGGGKVGFTEKGVASPGTQRHWSYTGNSPACTDTPAAHVHCTAENVVPADPNGTPPELVAKEMSFDNFGISHIDAIQGDFYMTDVSGSDECTVTNSDRLAFAVLLSQKKNIADLFSESLVIETARFGFLPYTQDIPNEDRSASCVDRYHPECDVQIDLTNMKIVVTKAG